MPTGMPGMLRRAGTLLPFTAIALLLALAVYYGTTAQESEPDAGASSSVPTPTPTNEAIPHTESLGFDEALEKDATWYANAFDVSQQEAERRLRLQADGTLSDLIDDLRAAAPDVYGGAWIQHQPEFAVVAQYTEELDVLSEVQGVAADAPVKVILREGATSREQLITDREAMEPIVYDALGARVASGLSVKDNAVRFYVPSRIWDEQQIAELKAGLEAAFSSTVVFQKEQGTWSNASIYRGMKVVGTDPGAASTDETPTPANEAVPHTESLDFEEALEKDARSYAADVGVSLDEAMRRLRLQADGTLSDLIDDLEAAAPGSFVDAWIEHEPEFAVVGVFADSAENLPEVQAIVDSAPVQVDLRDPSSPRAVLEAEEDRITGQARELFGNRMAAHVDEDEGVITIYVDKDVPAVLDKVEQLASRFDAQFSTPVEFQIKDEVIRKALMSGS